MNKPLSRFTLSCFAVCSLALGLTVLPALLPQAAFAGQTITIDGDVNGSVSGNISKPDHIWDYPDTTYLLDPNDNTVIVNSGTVDGDVDGGDAYSTSGSATASGNSVTINGGTVDGSANGGYAESTNGSATASGNSVTINAGEVTGIIFGGYATGGSATATHNTVTISGDKVSDTVYGGYASSASGNVTASGNRVTINGGEVDGDIYGGYARSDTGDATASGNSVTINGGTVNGNVYGGNTIGATSGTATNNTVTISGSPQFDPSTEIIGGESSSSNEDYMSGNTLNLWNYTSQGSVSYVGAFERYNFVLPVTQVDPVLKVTIDFFLGDPPGNTGQLSTVSVSTIGGAAPLQTGAKVTLVEGSIANNNGGSHTQAYGKHGATLLYDWTLTTTSSALTATVDKVSLNPQTKALAEGFLGGMALTTQGADLVAGQGMGQAVSAAGNGFGAFGALSGGSMRYNTGSHVDMNSVSLMTGLAYGVDTTPGHLTLGAFFEYGTGSYDTHNSFSNAASVDGDGDTYYLGGGVLGRMDFQNTGPGRFYTEASARIGQINNEYGSGDLTDGMERGAGYDSSSLYYGLHFGTGYIWNITEKASLDLYGKYFWTRLDGDSVTLSTGDPVRFNSADSNRLRVGTRFVYAVNEYASPYIGAAYEHEYDGKARASTYGYSIDAPSLRGDTGIGEIGLTLKPSQTLPLSFDLGVQGYTGVREGVTGSLQIRYEF